MDQVLRGEPLIGTGDAVQRRMLKYMLLGSGVLTVLSQVVVPRAIEAVRHDAQDAAHELQVRFESGKIVPITTEVNNLDKDTPGARTPNSISEAVNEAYVRQQIGEDIGVLRLDDAIALHKLLTGRDDIRAGEPVIVAYRDAAEAQH